MKLYPGLLIVGHSQYLGVDHPVQGSNEHRLLRVEARGGKPHIVGVRNIPGDNLDRKKSHVNELTRISRLFPEPKNSDVRNKI